MEWRGANFSVIASFLILVGLCNPWNFSRYCFFRLKLELFFKNMRFCNISLVGKFGVIFSFCKVTCRSFFRHIFCWNRLANFWFLLNFYRNKSSFLFWCLSPREVWKQVGGKRKLRPKRAALGGTIRAILNKSWMGHIINNHVN